MTCDSCEGEGQVCNDCGSIESDCDCEDFDPCDCIECGGDGYIDEDEDDDEEEEEEDDEE